MYKANTFSETVISVLDCVCVTHCTVCCTEYQSVSLTVQCVVLSEYGAPLYLMP